MNKQFKLERNKSREGIYRVRCNGCAECSGEFQVGLAKPTDGFIEITHGELSASQIRLDNMLNGFPEYIRFTTQHDCEQWHEQTRTE